MSRFRMQQDNDEYRVEVPMRGYDVIREPMLNKGTAFLPEERRVLGLEGLLPSHFNTMELQARRIYESIAKKPDSLDQYVSLAALQDRNEHLYYRLLVDHLEEFMPIVYTPTVGLATQRYSQVFKRGRGIWITPEFRHRIAEVLRAAMPCPEIHLIVVTDNESILGIGDQGAGGMAISIGKLALYCAGAGIHPRRTLPISLDVGTNNKELLDDDLYLGWRHPRITGSDYDELVEEFVEAVQEVFPGALIQWEDFRKDNALAILEKYKYQVPSFNDDIQGTGAVALAGLLSAGRIAKVPLEQQRVVIFGAGAAGLGVARQLRNGFASQGLEAGALTRAIAVLDSRGLLVNDREIKDAYKQELAWPAELAAEIGLSDPDQRDLESVVRHYQPTVLVGSSGQAGAFNESIVRKMASYTERPVILPLSNPTSKSEAIPEDLLTWSEGLSLVATGSPFDDVSLGGRTYKIAQGNNVFIFPGLGLGTLLAEAKQVTDGMISAASQALADSVTEDEMEQGLLFPRVARLRDVSRQVTAAVMRQAVSECVCSEISDDEIAKRLDENVWEPVYPKYIAV